MQNNFLCFLLLKLTVSVFCLTVMPVMLSSVVALCRCAGVAEFRGCSAANGGGGLGAACSWKQHAAGLGQPGHWSSASSGD